MNSIPELIPSLIKKMREGYDLVIVSRYLEEAVSHDDDYVSGNLFGTMAGNSSTDC